MSECDPQLLSAWLDDELSPTDRERAESHVRECPACASELDRLRMMCGSLRNYDFDDLDKTELDRLHEVIDEWADQPIWRIGLALSTMAASILIVGLAWLSALPAATNRQVVKTPEPWEQMAITLRPGAMMQASDTDIRLARADFADWMLQGLAEQK